MKYSNKKVKILFHLPVKSKIEFASNENKIFLQDSKYYIDCHVLFEILDANKKNGRGY